MADDVRRKAISAVYQGNVVDCTKEEYEGYSGVRKALQNQAALWIEDGDPVRAMIALQEVKRLDEKLKFTF